VLSSCGRDYRASADVSRIPLEEDVLRSLRIAPATPADVPTVLALIRELAEYEKLLHEVLADEALVHEALFGPRTVAECVLGWDGATPLGFALYYYNFSTFLARPGLYLEDLYVRPEHRGQGVGEALLRHLAQIAVAVLNWNRRAIEFYERMGAQGVLDWTVYRMSGEALRRLGS
jgi:GNAT superfamily N-acetyltransferase